MPETTSGKPLAASTLGVQSWLHGELLRHYSDSHEPARPEPEELIFLLRAAQCLGWRADMYDLKEIEQVRAMDGYPLEEQEQAWLIQWVKRHGPEEAKQLFAIPNGGHRSHSQGALLKLTGVQAGVPDLMLPVARNGYHGLWIEMKSTDPKSRPSKEQRFWMAYLAEQGYRVELCRGFEAARDSILEYLGEPA